MKKNIQAFILAAGSSKRFKRSTSKLLEPLCGKPLITYCLEILKNASIPATLIVGHQGSALQSMIETSYPGEFSFCTQQEQKGTGHALAITRHAWESEYILVINGDMPLLKKDTISLLQECAYKKNADIVFAIARHNDPTSPYGRILRNENGVQIIEARHFKGEHAFVNAGIYIFKRNWLEKNINALKIHGISNELYITDLIQIGSENNTVIETIEIPFKEMKGINTLQELADAEKDLRNDLITHWMQQGVRFICPESVILDAGVRIGHDAIISAGAHLINKTVVGNNCFIGPYSILDNAILEDDVTIYAHTIINDAIIQTKAKVGPFAHVYSNTLLEQESVIGNFVEVKRSSVGKKTKAKHLTFLGDAHIGSQTNIGAGTITCNYDGLKKHSTIIGNNAFIGSNNTLIAPLSIGNNAFTAGGSVITQSVPDHALALGRARQITKENYSKKKETTLQAHSSTPSLESEKS